MRLTEAIERARREVAYSDYIDNTERMWIEKNRWLAELRRLTEIQSCRAAEIEELV